MEINMGMLFKYDFYANIVHVLCSYNRKNEKKTKKKRKESLQNIFTKKSKRNE